MVYCGIMKFPVILDSIQDPQFGIAGSISLLCCLRPWIPCQARNDGVDCPPGLDPGSTALNCRRYLLSCCL